MGHLGIEKPYLALQERLDENPIGAPATKELFEILRLRFTEEEAEIGARMPMTPCPLEKLGARIGQEPARLEAKLERMAEKGLVMDFETNGRRFYTLAPTVIGFFEFTFMRLHKDLPNEKLADLLSAYMFENPTFPKNAFRESTQVGRAMVHEKTLSDEVRAEILPYEQTTEVLKKAELRAVGLCYCRHKMEHVDRACDAPMNICMTFGGVATSLIKHGFARGVDVAEGLNLLQQAQDHHLVQFGENVRQEVAFICNCCGCCCEAMIAARPKLIQY